MHPGAEAGSGRHAGLRRQPDLVIAPLNPEHITPDVSLNRVWIMDLPGVPLDADVRGRRAGDVLSAGALAALVRQHAAALWLSEADRTEDGRLLLLLDTCLAAGDSTVRAQAEAIARQFGRRLAYLVLTLTRGDAANRAARPEWDDSYWAYWAAIRQIWLGGGVMSGRLGPLTLAEAQATLAGAGLSDCALRLADQPAILPLLGAARAVPPGYRAAAVLDCGGTAIKRGVAHYAEGARPGLRLLPSLPAQILALGSLPPLEQAAALAPVLVEALAATWQAAAASGEGPVAPVLVASIAAYVKDNQPLDYQGGAYAALRLLSPNLGAWLAERVSGAVGQPVTVRLIHDGTAAARVFAGQPHSAVILLGTALGVGFPPVRGG
jgi:hypothetical protein